MALIDPEHPFYRPLWVRIAIVVFCLGWAAVEFITGWPLFGVLFAAAGGYAAYMFFMQGREGGGKGPVP